MKKIIITENQLSLLGGSLLNENKLYPNKLVDTITKKIGDSSNETKNKINISGLWRDYFGDIQQLKSKEELDKVFKSWYDKMISDMIKTKSFYNNKDLAEKYLNAYIENIGSLGDKATRFSLKKIEKGLVDLVNNNNWIKDTSVSTKSIYEPHTDDILYEDDNIIVLNAPNKSKCVTYGQGESWCIGKPELNYYNTYRLNYGATPYYVLQKNVEGDEHKLVIMNYGNGQYAIADRSNSGNRHGGKDVSMSWNDITQEIPNLKGKEQFFKYREITDDEKKYAEALEEIYDGDDLQSYFDKLSKELVVNGENVKSVDIVRDYVANSHEITKEQFNTLRDEVKDSLIESGYFLNYPSYGFKLNNKQIGRIARLLLKEGHLLNYRELMALSYDERNNYIKNLVGKGIAYLIRTSPNPDEFTKTLLNIEGFIRRLDDGDIYYLLKHLNNPDEVIKTLLNIEGFIRKMDVEGINDLVKFSDNPDEIIKILLNTESFIESLDGNSIRTLISNSTNRYELIKILLGSEGFVNGLDWEGINTLLEYSRENRNEVINILLGTEGFIQNLNGRSIDVILGYSSNPYEVLNIIKKVRPSKQEESRNLIKNLLREELNSYKNVFLKEEEINPWAICTDSVGREDKEKYEACVMSIKKKHNIKEEISNLDTVNPKFEAIIFTDGKALLKGEDNQYYLYNTDLKDLEEITYEVNDNITNTSLGVGYEDLQSGDYDMILIDNSILNNMDEIIKDTKTQKDIYDKIQITTEVTSTSTVGNYTYDANAFSDDKFFGTGKTKKKKGETHSKPAVKGGSFVEMNSCVDYGNNKPLESCQQGAVSGVVKEKK